MNPASVNKHCGKNCKGHRHEIFRADIFEMSKFKGDKSKLKEKLIRLSRYKIVQIDKDRNIGYNKKYIYNRKCAGRIFIS